MCIRDSKGPSLEKSRLQGLKTNFKYFPGLEIRLWSSKVFTTCVNPERLVKEVIFGITVNALKRIILSNC